ncbi:hypothetical protein H4F18_18920 [Vibrio scophthalmi]|uniref:hypothetical protein n=1 Tax=Vibrio scophthalmi TaxID=45658 RepID=UPI002FEED1F6
MALSVSVLESLKPIISQRFMDLPHCGFEQVGGEFCGRKVALSFGVSVAGLSAVMLLVRTAASTNPTGVFCPLSLPYCSGSHYFE